MEREDPSTLSDAISCWLYKIDKESDRLNWGELVNQATEAFNDIISHADADPIQVLIRPHAYLFRLYESVKHYKEPTKFNQVFKTTRLEDHEDKEYYGIKNYTYAIYLWALDLGVWKTVDNNVIYIPTEKLKPSMVKKLESMIQ